MSRKIAAGCRIGGSVRPKPAASRQSSARSPAPPSVWPAGSPLRGVWLAESTRIVWITRWPSWVFRPFNKAGPGAQPLTLPQGERSVSVRLPPQARHGRMTKGALPNQAGAIYPVMKPASALRLLRWIVLALLLTALGRAGAQETHRLNLDQTRATLTATETALRDKHLDDTGLQ